METALVMTGLTIGGMLVFPLALEWLKRFQFTLVAVAVVLVGLICIAPYSPGARTVLATLNRVPQTLADAAACSKDGIAKLSSDYFNAFHG